MHLTIEKYTQMVAPLDVRDLDLANAFHTNRLDDDVPRAHGEQAGAERRDA